MTNCQSNTVAKDDVVVGVLQTPSSHYAFMFNVKTNMGLYPKETVKCFCGADNSTQITEKDRYGIDYNLCLCNECGILYANPRMTEDAYKEFYNKDYRLIYSDMEERSSDGSAERKNRILDIIKDFEYDLPHTIFEIGCGNGDVLYEFDGDKYGVDYDFNIVHEAKLKGRNIINGGIEELEKLGIKADLIIMSHVLEHILNPERDLLRVRELLSDKGLLYVAAPPLYISNRGHIYQNAHTYQFNGNTLTYMMECCGYEELHLTEAIESLWKKGAVRSKDLKPQDARFIESFLTSEKFLAPAIRVSNKFSIQERKASLKYILLSDIKPIDELVNKHIDGTAIIICGGPSVNNYVDKIKELKNKGSVIFSIERMYQWCLQNGIAPDYVVAMDASDDVIEGFSTIHEDTTHILMSQCKPEVFELLKDKKTYFFLVPQRGIDITSLDTKKRLKKLVFINGQGSVSLGTISVAITLGIRNIHMFGFDCHITNGNYANGIVGVGNIKDKIEVEINGKTFTTTTAYFAFMQCFFSLYNLAKEVGQLKSIKLYGDSLVKHASKIDMDGDK